MTKTPMLPLFTSLLLILCSLSLFHKISAQRVDPRVLTGCAVLGTNVYCYGGYLGARGGQFISATSDHYTADLSQADLSVMKPTLNWKSIQAPASNEPPGLEPRANFPITAIDQTRYIILGGATTNATLNTSAVLYNSDKNSWQALADPPFYMSQGSMVSSSDTVWAYGGFLNSTNAATPPNTLVLDLSTLPGTWTMRANSVSLPVNSRHGHAAVLRNSQIYYFGGFYSTASSKSNPVPMNRINFYNTVSDQWGAITSQGDNPNNRTYHTATLIANSSKVLIYGGCGTDRPQDLPLLDYAYMWDLDLHKYRQLNTTPGDPGPRVGHSAVQYKNTILISFGMDSSGNLRSDTTLLDVSNPTAPVWVGAKPTSTAPVNNGEDGNTNTGAIAGGVVGGVVGVAIIAGAFFYYQRRKKNRSNRNDFDLYQPPQGFQTDDSPTLFTSGDIGHHSNNNLGDATATTIAPGSTNKNSKSDSPPLEMYPADPAPHYHHIKPDESEPFPPSNDSEPLSRVKPSGND